GVQVLQGFCPDCAAAAAQFALGGVLCGLAAGKRERLAFLAAVGAVCLVLGAAWAAGVARQGSLPAPGERAAAPGERPTAGVWLAKKQCSEGRKAELYFSPWCGPCGEAVAAWVDFDPEGRLWLPVVVPEWAFEEGLRELRGHGYRGQASAAPASPSRRLPCLALPDGRLVNGLCRVARAVSVLGCRENAVSGE
ncbi:MAG: hypothetical protein H5T97_00945, partial [Firmicutes bacterium]|nr:hypothetical protein [Bacillota bacterium]